MKRLSTILVLILAVAVMGSVAFADNIQYTTSGVFTSGASNVQFGNGTNLIAFNNIPSGPAGVAIRFNSGSSIPGGYTVPPVAGVSLGSFQTTWDCPSCGSSTPTINITGNFTLTISQTSPSSGTGTLGATISGTFILNGGSGSVTFDQNSVNIAGVDYALNNGLSNVIQLNAPRQWTGDFNDPNSWGTDSTIEAQVSVPEPASLALFGSGLVMGGNFVRRKVMGV